MEKFEAFVVVGVVGGRKVLLPADKRDGSVEALAAAQLFATKKGAEKAAAAWLLPKSDLKRNERLTVVESTFVSAVGVVG